LAAKKKTSKKQGNSIQRFARETIGELRKVSWPTRDEAWQLTLIVIATMIVIGIFLSVVSSLSGRLLNILLGI